MLQKYTDVVRGRRNLEGSPTMIIEEKGKTFRDETSIAKNISLIFEAQQKVTDYTYPTLSTLSRVHAFPSHLCGAYGTQSPENPEIERRLQPNCETIVFNYSLLWHKIGHNITVS